jgi:hypothetical protein
MSLKLELYENSFCAHCKEFSQFRGWSSAGLGALYAYLDSLSEDIGEDIEVDAVALACDWSEYQGDEEDLVEQLKDDYIVEGKNFDAVIDNLRDKTIVLVFDGGVLIQVF